MEKIIKRIIVSSDINKTYLNFWPSISYFWKSLGYNITLGLLVDNTFDNNILVRQLESFGDVIIVNKNENYNIQIQTKLLRWYLAKYYLNEIICIQDIDYYVFDKHLHIENEIQKINLDEYIFTNGYNEYNDLMYKYNFRLSNIKRYIR
jgi:hypothetical protein